MPPPGDDPTDETVAYPWHPPVTAAPDALLHLVIAWVLDEPDRTGQIAPLDRPCVLGRTSDGHGPALLRFTEERPGETLAAATLTGTAISRRQLEIEPLPDRRARVRSVGRRQLLHNGARVAECVVQAGDTLALEGAAVFLLETRPSSIAVRHPFDMGFPFGAPDAQGIVGETPAAWKLREELAAAAGSRAHVLLLGGSGAGKELAATAIHQLSARRAQPFVARNAATLPESLVDAELFGSARNYPNPGTPERPGLVGTADGGILFLDEIGELPEANQAHLLRLLDAGGQYHRLGEPSSRQSDLRLIAATNRSPGALKPDFLARFTCRIHLPGLPERRGDIPFLIRILMARIAAHAPAVATRFCEGGDPRKVRLEPRLVDSLLRHPYTHNTRELERLLEVSINTSPTDYLALTVDVEGEMREREREPAVERSSAPPAATPSPSEPPTEDGTPALSRDELVRALGEAGGKVTIAAERLGISRHALRRMLKRHGVTGEG